MIGSVYIKKSVFIGCTLTGILVLTPLVSSAAEAEVKSIDVVQELNTCKKIKINNTRLDCFDRVAIRFSPPLYKGRSSISTDVITLERPHRLRYRSYGVIFVLYIRDAEGNVLKNLHLGGAGEDSYLIEEPGDYTFKIQGSDNWEIWLEPEIDISEPSG